MNLDQLRAVQAREREKDGLQELRPTFYRDVAEYLSDLEAERTERAAAADDPFSSPEVNQLNDEIKTAREIVEAIYERRMGKIVKQASLAAAGLNADDEGLSQEEAELFGDLVDRIEANKERVMDVLEGADPEIDVTETANANSSPEDHGDDDRSQVQEESTEDNGDAESSTDTVGRITVRITESVGAIVGIDEREYDLRPNDVVTLPEANARPLLERAAATRIE